MSTTPEPTSSIPEDWSLDEWIESGTVARRTVTIYNDHAAANQLAALNARLADLGWSQEHAPARSDGPLAAAIDPAVTGLLAEREELLDRVVESGAVWTVRALSDEDVKAAFDPQTGVPEPKTPFPPLEKAGQRAQEKFGQEVASYRARVSEANEERNVYLVAAAVVSVESPRGTATHVTVGQLKALKARPHGARAFDKLFEAMNEATNDDVDVPRPTSREDSTSIPASFSR